MVKPSLDELLKHVDSKYVLVVMAARRARAITAGEGEMDPEAREKPVTQALQEICDGRFDPKGSLPQR